MKLKKGSEQNCFVLCWKNRYHAQWFVLCVSPNVSTDYLFICIIILSLFCDTVKTNEKKGNRTKTCNKEIGEFHNHSRFIDCVVSKS